MFVELKCRSCGKCAEIEVESWDWAAWRSGTLIQDAFPYLSADDRKMLISQTCDECWDNMFPAEEEVEEEFGMGIWD